MSYNDKENCFKCGGESDVWDLDYDMEHFEFVHKSCVDKVKCDYCDEYVEKVSNSPYLADAMHGHKICSECWEVTRQSEKGSTGQDIGVFDGESK